MLVPSDNRTAPPFLTRLLAAVILHDDGAATALSAFDPADVLREADDHGVVPLLLEALPAQTAELDPLRRRLTQEALAHTAGDIVRERELRLLVAALHRADVPCVMLKGAALAYTHYPRPDLRPRLDTDLLIPPAARDRAQTVLSECGYELQPQISADLVMYQTAFAKDLGGHARHLVDLHWRIANPQSFGGVLTFEELATHSTPVPALGPGAKGLGEVHALVLACVHRVAHHADAPNLIWIYDIDLLSRRFSDEAWERFLSLVHERGIGAVCRRSLEMAALLFRTSIPDFVTLDHRMRGDQVMHTPTAAHLDKRRHVDAVLDDFKRLPHWSQRLRLLRQHLLPPATYMREVYAPSSRAPLAVLYTVRALRGARRWLART